MRRIFASTTLVAAALLAIVSSASAQVQTRKAHIRPNGIIDCYDMGTNCPITSET